MIWILDSTTEAIARSLDDRSLSNMIKEIAQVLCNTHHLKRPRDISLSEWFEKNPMKIPLTNTFRLEEWTYWASICLANYHYLCDLAQECIVEFYFRKNLDFNRIVGQLNLSKTTGIDYAVWGIGGAILAGLKLHKYHESIEWCIQNSPELPKCSLELQCAFCDLPTEFPLVMPEKFIITYIGVYQSKHSYHPVNIIESYRAYYQHKLNKDLRRQKKELMPDYTGNIFTPNSIIPVWTRRQKPAWVTLEEVK